MSGRCQELLGPSTWEWWRKRCGRRSAMEGNGAWSAPGSAGMPSCSGTETRSKYQRGLVALCMGAMCLDYHYHDSRPMLVSGEVVGVCWRCIRDWT